MQKFQEENYIKMKAINIINYSYLYNNKYKIRQYEIYQKLKII